MLLKLSLICRAQWGDVMTEGCVSVPGSVQVVTNARTSLGRHEAGMSSIPCVKSQAVVQQKLEGAHLCICRWTLVTKVRMRGTGGTWSG